MNEAEGSKVYIDGELAIEDAKDVQIVDPATMLAQARVQAANLLGSMPDFWKDRFKKLTAEHGNCRRGRRAVSKMLRAYATWKRVSERRDALRKASEAAA